MKFFFPCWYIFSLFSDDFEIWRITYDVKFDTCKDYLDSRKQWNRNDKFIKKHNSENHTVLQNLVQNITSCSKFF